LAKDGIRYDYVAAIENGLFVQNVREEEIWLDMAWILIEDKDLNVGVATR